MKTVLLDEQHQAMFFLTRGTVGGRILRVDLTFSDGKELKSVKVIDESLVELPDEYAVKTIQTVSVPFKQY